MLRVFSRNPFNLNPLFIPARCTEEQWHGVVNAKRGLLQKRQPGMSKMLVFLIETRFRLFYPVGPNPPDAAELPQAACHQPVKLPFHLALISHSVRLQPNRRRHD